MRNSVVDFVARRDEFLTGGLLCVQLSREHQRLTQHCLDLDDQLAELRQQNSPELASLERQLQSELSLCLLELDAIVTVCVQSANGEEPNVSCLLGLPRKSGPLLGHCR